MKRQGQPRSFLGTGWAFPPQFAAQGSEVRLVSGVEDIHQSLQILLSTSLGERILQEDFGCDLSSLQFEEADQALVNAITSLVTDAIVYHETRVKLQKIDVSQDSENPGIIYIRLDYTVKTTNSRYNMVYPFYLNEAVAGV